MNCNGTRVRCIRPDGRVGGDFKSLAAAGRRFKVWPNAVRRAVEAGNTCAGHWWRYPDMPAICQPLRRSKAVPLLRNDGVFFTSIHNAVAMAAGVYPQDGQPYKTARRGLEYAIAKGRAWRGFTYTRMKGRPGACRTRGVRVVVAVDSISPGKGRRVA